MSERRFSQGVFPWVVAHRGDSANESENTIASFQAAIDRGADAVEFDVRVTADGQAVVIHDPDVSRTTDGRGLVRQMTLAQIKRLRIATSHGPAEIPTLAETMQCVSGRAAADIEIKNIPGEADFDEDREVAAEAIMDSLVDFDGEVLLSSFNPSAIQRVLQADPAATTGLLVTPGADLSAAVAFALEHGHTWVLPDSTGLSAAGRTFIERAHQAGLRVGTWVVDDPDQAAEFMRSGVDAIATNDPDRIVRARRRELGR